MITFFTDTDTDTTPEIAQKYGYKLISMPYSVGDKTIRPYEDFTEFDYKPFYDMLRAGTLPSTSALSKDDYIRYFEPEFQAGNDICYVHFSGNMSATFGFMEQALAELKAKYPDRKFYGIDTKAITILSLIIVEEIGDMILAGKSIDEIMKWSETEIDKFGIYLYANDLKFFKRSGRVGGLAAAMGTIFGVRPIINIDSDGKMQNVGKERGKTNTLNRLVETMEELGDDIKNHRIIIGHTDAFSDVELVKQKLKEKFGDGLNIQEVVVNPTAGSHCGPSSLGIAFHVKHR